HEPPTLHACSNAGDALLDIAHACVGPLAHLRDAADGVNGVEHARKVMGVEGEHRGAARDCRGRRLRVPRGHGAHLTHALRQQQVGPRGGESRAVDFVHAAELAQGLPHGGVDLAAREPVKAESWTRVRTGLVRAADGWSQPCETPTRRSPNPSSYAISVALGRSDAIRATLTGRRSGAHRRGTRCAAGPGSSSLPGTSGRTGSPPCRRPRGPAPRAAAAPGRLERRDPRGCTPAACRAGMSGSPRPAGAPCTAASTTYCRARPAGATGPRWRSAMAAEATAVRGRTTRSTRCRRRPW